MKVPILFILIICLFSDIFSQFYENDDSLQYKRSEFFSTQRVFPYDSIPSTAYTRAYDNKNNIRQQNGFYLAPNNTWNPLGPAPVNMAFGTNQDASGRTKMVLFNPQNPNVAYVATAGGGLWKTSNVWAPRTSVAWTHLTWNMPPVNILASGAFCIDPYDPTGNTIYYGTGEATNFWCYNNVGDGIYKSTDGGVTWVKGQGLPPQTKVYRITVRGSEHRSIIYAALGTTYWHNPYIQSRNCGLYKSVDGGLNWTVEPWSENLHCTEIAFNPQNDMIGYCFGPPNGGQGTFEPGTDYRRTTDGGASWFFVGPSAFDHTGYHDDTYASISPTNPNYIYVLTCESGTIAYRSTDGGNSFKWMGNYHFDAMWDYNMVIRVSPYDPNIVFVGDKNIRYTTNAGAEPCSTVVWNQLWPGSNYVHDDTHYIDFEPVSGPPPDGLPNYRFLVTCDGGVYRTTNGGSTFESLNESINPENCLNTALLYSVSGNPFDENKVLGSAQDNAIQVRNGSNYWTYSTGTWGDGMYVVTSPVKKDNAIYFKIPAYSIGYSTNGGNSFESSLNVVHNAFIPLVSHPTEPGTFYLAQTDLWKSINNGINWTQPWNPNGNHRIDNTDPSHIYYVNALDVVNSDLLYAATYYNDIWDNNNNKQHLWRSSNGGQTWDNLFIEQKGFVNRFITSVKVNKSNNDEILVTLSGFSNPPNDGHHIYRTLNGGENWEDITGNLSQMDAPVNDLIIYDFDCSSEKYVIATDVGVYITDAYDQSHTWQELGPNLPNVSCLKLDYFRPAKKTSSSYIWSWRLGNSNGC